MTEDKGNNPNTCIWKPPIKRKIDGTTKLLQFPCRYPDKEKTSDVCTPCLLGDVFVTQYTQMANFKQQAEINEEVMAFLRSFTSDGSLDDLK